jgi:protocatechuate 3,4-dioxygenase beta subunit
MKKYSWGALAFGIVLGAGLYVAQKQNFTPPNVKVLSAAEKANCGITAQVTEGPYYVSGTAPLANNEVNVTHLQGTPISVTGHVYQGLENSTPIANAKIEIWHTDATGNYHPNNNGPTTNYKSEEIALRGFVLTNDKGEYHFTTIYPGEYSGRTRHIHIKITPQGKPTLTTQLIIPSLTGDALTFDDDTVSKGLPSCHLLTFDKTQTPEVAVFDFRL